MALIIDRFVRDLLREYRRLNILSQPNESKSNKSNVNRVVISS